MSDEPGPIAASDPSTVIADLRRSIGEIEATSADLVRRPRPAPEPAPEPAPFSYFGMPEGDDWMAKLPARYHDGERGFDRRIMEELAAAGVPCYSLQDLTGARTIPAGIPIFVDWLTHLEERIPGPETEHRRIIRTGLIRNLNDLAARKTPGALELLITQLERRPALTDAETMFASFAVARVATKKDFPRVRRLLDELPPEVTRGPLIEYLGRVRTPEARQIALHYLDDQNGYYAYFAIKALTAMRATGVRHRIEPYLLAGNGNEFIRKVARQALLKLPD